MNKNLKQTIPKYLKILLVEYNGVTINEVFSPCSDKNKCHELRNMLKNKDIHQFTT